MYKSSLITRVETNHEKWYNNGMQLFAADIFFDLTNYAHPNLFASCEYVWQALPRIAPYLGSLKLGVIEGQVSPNAYLINPEAISIGKGTIVDPGAYIKGPCIIGNHCHVRHGAYIRGEFIAGDHCVIGHDTEIKNSIFLNETRAGHFAYIGDSIIGNDVNLGAGTKCANLKLDDKEVVIHFQGDRYPTGLRKFGAIIGDKCQIGCNVVLNPGALLGKNVDCYPCINLGGFVQADQLVKSQTSLQFISKYGMHR